MIQNLQDAGCQADMIAAFVQDMHKGQLQAGQRLLELHRRSLLDELHRAQKHIDRLDYLLYQLNKHNMKGDQYEFCQSDL